MCRAMWDDMDESLHAAGVHEIDAIETKHTMAALMDAYRNAEAHSISEERRMCEMLKWFEENASGLKDSIAIQERCTEYVDTKNREVEEMRSSKNKEIEDMRKAKRELKNTKDLEICALRKANTAKEKEIEIMEEEIASLKAAKDNDLWEISAARDRVIQGLTTERNNMRRTLLVSLHSVAAHQCPLVWDRSMHLSVPGLPKKRAHQMFVLLFAGCPNQGHQGRYRGKGSQQGDAEKDKPVGNSRRRDIEDHKEGGKARHLQDEEHAHSKEGFHSRGRLHGEGTIRTHTHTHYCVYIYIYI